MIEPLYVKYGGSFVSKEEIHEICIRFIILFNQN